MKVEVHLPPISDVSLEGIEIFVSFHTEMNTTDFMTDSNGLEIVARSRQTGIFTESIYPVTNTIAIQDKSFFVVRNDRS